MFRFFKVPGDKSIWFSVASCNIIDRCRYMILLGLAILTILLASQFCGNQYISQLSRFCVFENAALE